MYPLGAITSAKNVRTFPIPQKSYAVSLLFLQLLLLRN